MVRSYDSDSRCHSKSTEKIASKRSPNWSDEEIRTLCAFVKEHKSKLFSLGKDANKKGINAAKKQHWELAAAVISSQCSTKRHWSQVRKKWKDLSYLYARNASKKRPNVKQSCKPTQDELTQEEEPIKLTDVSSLSSTDSSSSCESASSVSTSSVINDLTFCDVSIKAEVLDQVSPIMHDIPPPDVSQGQNSNCLNRHSNGLLIENHKGNCCCGHGDDKNNLNEKLSSLIKNVLKKMLENHCDVTAPMSAYEKARIQIEREKIAMQDKTAKYLRDISKEIRQISASFCRGKRRRQSRNYAIARKRRRWKSESDSSV